MDTLLKVLLYLEYRVSPSSSISIKLNDANLHSRYLVLRDWAWELKSQQWQHGQSLPTSSYRHSNLFSHSTSSTPARPPSERWSHMLHSITCLRCLLWSLTWTWHPAKAAPRGVQTISQHFVVKRTHNMCTPGGSGAKRAAPECLVTHLRNTAFVWSGIIAYNQEPLWTEQGGDAAFGVYVLLVVYCLLLLQLQSVKVFGWKLAPNPRLWFSAPENSGLLPLCWDFWVSPPQDKMEDVTDRPLRSNASIAQEKAGLEGKAMDVPTLTYGRELWVII